MKKCFISLLLALVMVLGTVMGVSATSESVSQPSVYSETEYNELPNMYADNTVDAPTGNYVGKTQANGIIAWKGIQYATAGRFEAPVLVPESDETYI